ncbi:MAG: hypothetical protein JWN17_350 [Frankiales bacterium]|nr:hypothetical protein [Frankiales bacterium]
MIHLATYVGLLHHSEQTLADSFRTVGQGHAQEVDVFHMCSTLAAMSEEHVRLLGPVAERYGDQSSGDEVDEPDRLHAAGLAQTREGAIGLLRDLQDLHLLATLCSTTWTVVAQGAQGLRDHELLSVAEQAGASTSRQLSWLVTRLKAAAPQALLVSP